MKNNVNDQIEATRVILIDSDGTNRGEVTIQEARKVASDQSLDLVEVSSNDPVVCRIMDFGKHLFDQKKKQKESRKTSRTQEVKEIRLRPSTGQHDLEIKSRKAREFIKKGMKVRIDVRLKGRERQRPELANDIVRRFSSLLEDVGSLEAKGSEYTIVPR